MKNYYQILEVNENASQEVIEKAYRVLAKKYHPDNFSSYNSSFAEEKFKEITEAYEILSNEVLRQEYDIKIGLDTSLENKYNNLFNENEKLKIEMNRLKLNNTSVNYVDNNPDKTKKESYVRRYSSALNSIIQDEINKPTEERKKDLKALLLTIVIISVLVFVFWKVPFLHKFLFL